MALTGAGGHTAGTKGVTALGVGHGLKGIRVVGDQGRAVQLTDATVVEVEASLGGQAAGGHWAAFPMGQGQEGGTRQGAPSRGVGPRGTYQAVRVLGARAAGSTLLVAAVGGQ